MATAHKSRVLDMTQGDPFRLVLQFSMPLFCSNLLQQLYNLTDTALAGHLLGSAALAEIGATAALYGLIMNFAFGMNNGLALTVSRYFGAGDESGIRRAVGCMVTLSAAVSLVLTGCSLLGRDALLTVLQVPAQAWGGASAYLTVILLGIPLTMLYNMEAALLRAVGNSVTPLLFLLFSSVLKTSGWTPRSWGRWGWACAARPLPRCWRRASAPCWALCTSCAATRSCALRPGSSGLPRAAP